MIKRISQGFPDNRQELNPILREYWEVRDRLTHHNNIVYMDNRIVIPRKLRKQVLENLHSAHQGIQGMKLRANASIYWPGMSKAVANTRLGCRSCNENAPSQPKETLVISEFPEWPFQRIAADYFFIDTHSYLVVADRYSGWINVHFFRPGQATNTVLQNIF